jgi:outer membrane protein assembly factor BamB
MRAILALMVAAPLSALGADWPQFRGPGGTGISQEKGLPTSWSKSEGIAWKAELPGRGLSNPVIAGGRVYVTACSMYRQMRLHVLCFDEATGKKLWERQLTATGKTACHPDTNMAAPTPVTDGKAVYALFATGDLAAYSKDGDLLWYRSLVGDYPDTSNQVGMASSPVLVAGALFVPMDNAIDSFAAGIDLRTGKNLWREKRKSSLNWVTPVAAEADGKPMVVYTKGDEAAGYDPKTGKQVWSFKAPGLSGGIPSSTFASGVLYVPGGELRALRVSKEGAEELWSAKGVTAGYASPVIHDGKVYGLLPGFVTCFDATTGKEVWRHRAEGPFEASPVIADGHLYAVSKKGRTLVVKLGEKPVTAGRNDLEDTIQATPAVANGRIYLRSDRALYCIGPKRE